MFWVRGEEPVEGMCGDAEFVECPLAVQAVGEVGAVEEYVEGICAAGCLFVFIVFIASLVGLHFG